MRITHSYNRGKLSHVAVNNTVVRTNAVHNIFTMTNVYSALLAGFVITFVLAYYGIV